LTIFSESFKIYITYASITGGPAEIYRIFIVYPEKEIPYSRKAWQGESLANHP